MNKKFYLLTLMLALTLTVVACTPKEQKTVTDAMSDEKMMKADEVNINLPAQNDSGQSGIARLSRENNQTRVIINMENYPSNIAQPAHIHLSSCATIGGVKYPLNSLVDGASNTLVDADLDDLLNLEQLSINVHKSAAEASVYVACGDLPYGTTMGDSMKDEKKMEGEGAMMEAPVPGYEGVDEMMVEDDKMMEGNDSMMAETKVFEVGGVNFAFDIKEIRVKKGDKVKINFTNNGGFHDWVVDEFDAATSQIKEGESSSVEFVANKAGTFEYYCSVGSHRQLGMVGKLIVE